VEIRQQEYENGVWLQHADFAVDLQNLLELHVTGTCEWFLQSDRYIEWLQPSMSTKSNLLWVQGKPGSGKSTLAAQIVQDIQSRPGSIALFVLCKDSEENKNDLGSILRNLVFQLLESSPQRKSFHQIMQTARLNTKTPRVQSIAILWTLLERML
jgi:ABC-type polar amino acid transport system ATPase subunit